MNKIIADTIKLNSKKLILLSVLIAFYLILSFLSKILNLTIFFNAPFLKIELSDFVFIVSLFLVGKFYTSVAIILVSFLRIAYLSDSIVDVLALMLSDLLYVWFFIMFYYCFKKIIISFTWSKNKKFKQYLLLVISLISATIVTTIVMSFFNWLFIYNVYVWIMGYPKAIVKSFKKILIPTVVPFNIIKFSLNDIIFINIFYFIMQTTNKLNLAYVPIFINDNSQNEVNLLPHFKEEVYF